MEYLELPGRARSLRRVGKIIGTRNLKSRLDSITGTCRSWVQLVIRFGAEEIAEEVRSTCRGPTRYSHRAPLFHHKRSRLRSESGWSWPYKPFPKQRSWSTSTRTVLIQTSPELPSVRRLPLPRTALRPSVNVPSGDSVFDPTLSFVPRYARAGFYAICGGMMVYTLVEVFYHTATLIGRILLRQLAWRWPALTHRQWTSTSMTEFRWHQIFRYIYVVFGAALFRRPGALVGAFAVSGVMHDLGMWGLGQGTEFRTVGGFFLHGYGLRYSIGWGTLMIDAFVSTWNCGV
ncbi:hypothetical protein BGY98DRAFT_1148178 [Russula aff. rugulosa BPL654]|nr:hypothetical protein BGY98DRAFT_1148178 [Russula aff. rugulosa BPL654]